MRNSNNLIENRTEDILACSAVRKPSASQRIHFFLLFFSVYSCHSLNVSATHATRIKYGLVRPSA